MPSGGAMAATVLLRLAAWTGEARYREAAERAIGTVAPYLVRYPTGFAQWLVAATFAAADVVEVAVVGDLDDAATRALLAPAWATWRPFQVLAATSTGRGRGRGRWRLGGAAARGPGRDRRARHGVRVPRIRVRPAGHGSGRARGPARVVGTGPRPRPRPPPQPQPIG